MRKYWLKILKTFYKENYNFFYKSHKNNLKFFLKRFCFCFFHIITRMEQLRRQNALEKSLNIILGELNALLNSEKEKRA